MSARETAYDGVAGAGGVAHSYGDRVHVLAEPYTLSSLARLCSAETIQPEFNQRITALYRHLMVAYVNHVLPCVTVASPTRMNAVHSGGMYHGTALDPDARLVTVDIARAGVLPSQVCFDMANTLLPPANVRQDHLVMARTTDAAGQVTGAEIQAAKVGGRIDGTHLLLPDPMGATGGSLSHAVDYLRRTYGEPASVAALHLIVTPQYLRAIQAAVPGIHVFALRVDRGASPADVLATPLGARWDEEDGLTELDYIVPGGGGFGELMNNSDC